jgi:hypothetical protein
MLTGMGTFNVVLNFIIVQPQFLNIWEYNQNRVDCWTAASVFRSAARVFRSVVAGVFQIVFRVEIHANDVFLFFKNYFWHQHIKTIQKIQTALNFSKKKKI